jgi:hypothetical protein
MGSCLHDRCHETKVLNAVMTRKGVSLGRHWGGGGHVEVVVGDDFDKLLAEPLDAHPARNALHDLEGVNVRPNVLQQRRHQRRLREAVRDQRLPQ